MERDYVLVTFGPARNNLALIAYVSALTGFEGDLEVAGSWYTARDIMLVHLVLIDQHLQVRVLYLAVGVHVPLADFDHLLFGEFQQLRLEFRVSVLLLVLPVLHEVIGEGLSQVVSLSRVILEPYEDVCVYGTLFLGLVFDYEV